MTRGQLAAPMIAVTRVRQRSGRSRKAAATCRKVSGLPEGLLQPAGRFRTFPKACRTSITAYFGSHLLAAGCSG